MDAFADLPGPRSTLNLVLFAGLLIALFTGFIALGTWQVHRRSWKLELISRVEQRVHAQPVAAPGRNDWPAINSDDEYRAVRVQGRFLNDRETLVQAVTAQGAGFWVIAPLQTTEGFVVLVNRGFVDADHRGPATRQGGEPQAPVTMTGLLRLSEPKGGFLRRNDPAAGRWYSRDMAAIATAQQLPVQDVAPYFIDADATSNPGGWPIGGLTVLRFHNSHLVYAITWYTLALMVAGAAVIAGRQEWRLRRGTGMSRLSL